jgi:hypothetical protein
MKVTIDDLLSVKEASIWATKTLGKNITPSNISYLIQYGRIRKYSDKESIYVSKCELDDYYRQYNGWREISYKDKFGSDLNWELSFAQYKESETTKHVHRLHPYKGKFIPQLAEYFLDGHKDNFKKQVFFEPGDVVLDPFSGSGTTMVESCELGLNCIGIDISEFNSMMANCKVRKYNIQALRKELSKITIKLREYLLNSKTAMFEQELLQILCEFNANNFPVPEYKYRLRQGEINEKTYGEEKTKELLPVYYALITKYGMNILQKPKKTFLDKWYLLPIREEIDLVNNEIGKIMDNEVREIVCLILSRTARSCRATTHSDLATIYEPVSEIYYCSKHGKICKPLFSILKWWETYAKDTLKRLAEFDALRTETFQISIVGDSRNTDILEALREKNYPFYEIVSTKKIKGIFSSPPYVGLIDYHEQHAYAYDLFGFIRQDEVEIGPLFKGQGNEAKQSYIDGISKVLMNSKNCLVDDYSVFLVANDKHDLYPQIAEKAGMEIVSRFNRPVLNRTEKDKSAYSETIFYLKEKDHVIDDYLARFVKLQ